MNPDLKFLNLTEDEKKVYLQIVAFSQLSIEELVNYTGIEFENLEKILNELINKKYVNKIESLNRYICKFPFIETVKEFSGLITDLKNYNDDLTSFIKDQKTKIQQEDEARKQKVASEVTEIIRETSELNNEFDEKYKTTYESAVEGVTNENTILNKALKENLNAKNDDFNNSQEIFTSEWIEKLNNFQEKGNQALNNIKEHYTNFSGKFDSELTEIITNQIQEIVESISQFASESGEGNNQFLIKGQNSSNQLNDKLLESISKIYSAYSQLINDLRENISNFIKLNDNSLQEIVMNSNSTFKENIKLEFRTISEKINSHLDEVKNLTENSISEQTDKQTKIKNDFLLDLENYLTQFDENLTSSSDTTFNKLEQQIQEFNEQNHNLSTDFKSFNTKHLDSSTQNINEAQNNINNFINENFLAIDGSISNIFQDFKSRINEIETSIKENSNSLKNQLSSNLESLIENWQESLLEFKSKTDESLLNHDKNKQESTNNFTSTVDTHLKDWSINQKEKMLYLMASKDEKINQYQEIEKNSLDNFFQQSTQLRNDLLTLTEDKLASLKSDIETVENERIQAILEENKLTFSKLSEQINKTLTDLENIGTEQEIKNKSEASMLIDTIKSSLSSLIELMQSKIQFTTNAFTENVNASKNEILNLKSNFLTDNLGMIQTTIDQGINEQNSLFESCNTSFQENQNKIRTELSEMINNIENMSINQINETVTSVLLKMEDLSKIQGEIVNTNNSTMKKVEEISRLLSSFVSEQYKAIDSEADVIKDKLSSSIKSSENILSIKSNTLQELDEKTNNYKYPVINSAPVFGLKGVQYHIENMFKRLKSKMTIFIPNPDLLPEELILSAKMSQQITVISMFDKNRHKSMLEKFVDKDNIQIRSLEGSNDVPPFIGCDKDAEESLFGSYENQEFVGMQTTQTSFIELIGKRVIASFLPLAKKITRNDLN